MHDRGHLVPPLIVRRASTTVELRDGQSFVIGGLLQSISTERQPQLPWLGDMPVLGALFRSASYQKHETDLAIIVTPRLVRPARPGDVLKTPLDTTLPANDVDLFLMGKTEMSPRQGAARSTASRRAQFTGHMLDLPKGGDDVRLGRATRTIAAAALLGHAARRLLRIYFDRRDTFRCTPAKRWPPTG